MNILVTGAAGFIGSHTTDQLLALGHSVVAVDNFNDYYNPAFKEENVSHHSETDGYKLYRVDITDFRTLKNVFSTKKIDAIIHLAAQAGVRASIENPRLCQKRNVEATANILDIAKDHNVEQIVIASSSSVYGNQRKTPFSESDPVDHPISPYAATKRACELMGYTYHHLYGMNVTCLRLFTVYGERGRPDMSPYIFTRAILSGEPIKRYGDGTMKRDFTYVKDIVNGIVASLDNPLGYEIINLGNSVPVELNEYIAIIERVTGTKAIIDQQPVPPGDVRTTYADVSKAKRLLDWEPTTSLEEGLTTFVSWFKNHRLNTDYAENVLGDRPHL